MASTTPESKRKRFGNKINQNLKNLRLSVLYTSGDRNSPGVTPGAGHPSPNPSTPGPSTPTQPAGTRKSKTETQAKPNVSHRDASSTNVQPGPPNELKRISDCVLSSALQALKLSTQAFPPLKPVVDDFLGCLDIIRASTSDDQEYKRLTSDLTDLVNDIRPYVDKLGLEDRNGSAARIVKDIEKEVAYIKQQQDSSKIRELIDIQRNGPSTTDRYRRVEILFQRLQADICCRALHNGESQLSTTLLQGMSPAHDALYNSGYSTTIRRRGCTDKTREQVQSEIHNWINDPNGAKIYWLNGMAGTGKTTIAYSLCEWLQKNQQLGGSYFCSRASQPCSDVNLIMPTIAYQLAQYSPKFRAALCQVLQNDLSSSRLNVVKQFENLIQGPTKLAKDPVFEGVVIVIDALDECKDDYGVRLTLGTLLKLGTNLPLKFFVTSRPEPAIRNSFLFPDAYTPTILRLHDIERSIVEEDIKKYLADEFTLLFPPPTKEQIGRLAKQSGKLFIYAATVVRYVQYSKGPVNPIARLNTMLATIPGKDKYGGASKKYEQLDSLYNTVLAAAFDPEGVEQDELDAMQLILWTVVCAKEPMKISTLAAFLSMSEEQAKSALQPLYSVLHVSESNGVVSVLHASFADYMLEHSRSGRFSCNEADQSEFLATRCFDVMKERLRFNICRLESSFVPDDAIVDLEERIRDNISLVLLYACRYWGDHLLGAGFTDTLSNSLVEFLSKRLLFWMEVLNLKKCIVNGMSTLVQVERWLHSVADSADMKIQAADARDFVTRFAASPCARGTPHLYLSALPLCAKSSSIYKSYWRCMNSLIEVGGTVMNGRNDVAQATWHTNSMVFSVGFSPDGTRIVSGCRNGDIRVCDSYTGEVIVGPFNGDTGSVISVSFSPDGARIVSGSSQAIRVWDACTGEVVVGTFDGHTGPVNSVAFSPDGTRIVSGSSDRTIRVWDACTGNAVDEPFNEHAETVDSIAFSADGMRIVSGSWDRTVRVWSAHTGEVVAGPFKGHAGWIRSVAFSPDGTRIVSGSSDGTIQVWDAKTGEAATTPFKGHTDLVMSVGFSPDGTRIVSGSLDRTIRVWNALTGEVVAGPFRGHINAINSVAFSPDGTRIVSGSSDHTIRVWGCISGVLAVTLSGTSTITSVAYSPEGTRIASGSSDTTIRLWDACTGEVIASPLVEHTEPFDSITFSPDSTRIAAGSRYGNIQIYDSQTGRVVAGPFQEGKGPVNSISFYPDSTRIISGSLDGTIRVRNAHTGDEVPDPLNRQIGWVMSVACSPDGTRIVSGCLDKTIQVWTQTGELVAGPFSGHTDLVKSVAFSPDGTRIVSGSWDKTILVWNVHTGEIVAGPLYGHSQRVNSVAFSPDGTRVVSASSDATIRVWDISSSDQIFHEEKRPHVHNNHVFSLDECACKLRTTQDGWVMLDDLPIVWIPADILEYMGEHDLRHTRLIIGSRGSFSIDWSRMVFGGRWSECYTLK